MQFSHTINIVYLDEAFFVELADNSAPDPQKRG